MGDSISIEYQEEHFGAGVGIGDIDVALVGSAGAGGVFGEVVFIADSKGLSGSYFVYGEYISSTLDVGGLLSSYRIFWEGSAGGGTQILFQTATNNDNATWDFVGPDGTGYSYFDSPGVIYFPESVGSYFRYKIILTGGGNATPVVDKVTVTYAN